MPVYGLRLCINRTYAVSHANDFLACGSMVLPVFCVSVFALVERKNRNTKEDKVPLRKIPSGPPRKSYALRAPQLEHDILRALPERHAPQFTQLVAALDDCQEVVAGQLAELAG